VGIEVTDDAVAVLRRSIETGIGPRPAGIRLRAARALGGGVDVQVELAEGPSEGETVVEAKGITLFVDPDVQRAIPDAILTVEPQHDIVVVRAAGTEGD
jgi:Fe-S cluster assembly iron-binding protein IscA